MSLLLTVFFIDVIEYLFFLQRSVIQFVNGSLLFNLQLKIAHPKISRIKNIDIEEIMQRNIEKLKARYPEKFTQEKALSRNLDAERNILEGNKD